MAAMTQVGFSAYKYQGLTSAPLRIEVTNEGPDVLLHCGVRDPAMRAPIDQTVPLGTWAALELWHRELTEAERLKAIIEEQQRNRTHQEPPRLED